MCVLEAGNRMEGFAERVPQPCCSQMQLCSHGHAAAKNFLIMQPPNLGGSARDFSKKWVFYQCWFFGTEMWWRSPQIGIVSSFSTSPSPWICSQLTPHRIELLVLIKGGKYDVSLELDLGVWGQIFVFAEYCLFSICCWTPHIKHIYLNTFLYLTS